MKRKCQCRFGSLGPASFGFCQRCSGKHDGGNGQAGVKFDAWARKTRAMRWGVFCSAALAAGVKEPRYKARTRDEARKLVGGARRECATRGSRHVVRRLEIPS